MTDAGGQDQVTLTIDDLQVTVPKGTIILKAAEKLGIEIPVFCYHDKLKPIGACRQCLVDVEGAPKPVPSCATEVRDGMIVHTRTPEVREMWKNVLEFLLVNHPLDCPVCDRGGECPLQDNTFKYGPPDTRFTGEKRHFVKPVPLSDNVILDRERCIMCTRCVRFCQEISEHEQLKIWDRGHGEYIDTFPGKEFDSNFSGNTIELCPVGALLSRVFRFRARRWDMKSTPSVCPHCAVGCNIQVDARNNREVVRFLSRENAEVDDGWLCDRGRFDSDFPNSPDRLLKPLARKNGELVEVEWDEALDLVANGLRQAVKDGPVGAIGSPWRTNEDNYLLQKLFREGLGSNNLDFTFESRAGDIAAIAAAYREGLFDGSIKDIASSDVIAVIGTDISVDAPILDLWIKKARRGGARILTDLSDETVQALRGASSGLILIGFSALESENGAMLQTLRNLKSQISNLRYLLVVSETNALGAMDMGLLPGYVPGYVKLEDGQAMGGGQMVGAVGEGEMRALFVMANTGDAEALGKVPFLVVADAFLTDVAKKAHVVLPSCTFAERDGTFTNTERRVQRINQAMRMKPESRPDWEILRDIGRRLGLDWKYEDAEDVFREIAETVAQYSGMNYDSVGDNGVRQEP